MRNQRLSAQLESFGQQVQQARYRLSMLPDSIKAAELLQELETSLEELRVAEEEMAQQEEALEIADLNVKLAHAHYRELFEFAPLGYLVTDTNGMIIEANRTAITLLNVKPQYLVDKPLAVYVAEADKYYMRSRLLGLQQASDIQSWEMHLQPRHRSPVPVAVTCVRSLLNQSSSGSSVIRWLLYDLTLRKQAEEAEREKVFRSTFEQAAVGMAYLTPAGGWLRVNQKWCQMTGYSREELLDLNDQDITHADDMEQSQRAHQQLIELKAEQVTYEKRFRCKDGSNLWTSVTASLVFGGDEKPLYIVSVFEDISARKTAEEAERQQRVLAEALHNTAIQLTSTLKLNEVLDYVLIGLGRVIPHDAAAVLLTRGKTAQFVRTHGLAEAGLPDLEDIQLVSDDFDVLRDMTQNQLPVCFPVWNEQSDWSRRFPQLKHFYSFVTAPIIFQGKVLGFIQLFSRTQGFFSEQHAQILRAFAAQAAIAIQNAQLFQQARELAVLEDRQRLARDLHDAVSQTLFSSVLITETLPQVLQRSKDDALEYLRDLESLNRSAMAEMRVLLLELRPEQLMRIKLQDQIVHLTEAAKGRKSIDFHLSMEEDLEMPPSVRISFFRITQEALNNIIKHSYATRVDIQLMRQSGAIELRIQDNGRGFQPEAIKAGLGMSTMRERAQEINARLRVQSGFGEGTIIRVIWRPPGR